MQTVDDLGCIAGSLTILGQHLLGGCNLHATHLKQVVDEAHLFDVFLRVLTDTSAALLGLDVRELLLPLAQQRLCHIELFGYFGYAVVFLEFFVRIVCHVDLLFDYLLFTNCYVTHNAQFRCKSIKLNSKNKAHGT